VDRYLIRASNSEGFRALLVGLARARRGRLFTRTRTPVHAPTGVRPPFFVVGSGRSGTTLVRAMLHAHSRLAIPPESYVLRTIGWQARVYRSDPWPRQVRRLLDAFDTAEHRRTWGLDMDPIRDRLMALPREERGSDRVVDAVYRAWAGIHSPGAARWGDKTPINALHLPWIDDLFPGAPYIHVLRDGRDAALSMVRAGLYQTLEAAADRWVAAVKQLRRFTQRLPEGRVTVVRYEELVQDPVGHAGRLADFLGEEYEPGMLEYWRRPEDLGYTDHAHFRGLDRPVNESSVGRWRSLSAAEVERLEAALGPTLVEAGYG
jgi:protein-tyrosine sulfotransferase